MTSWGGAWLAASVGGGLALMFVLVDCFFVAVEPLIRVAQAGPTVLASTLDWSRPKKWAGLGRTYQLVWTCLNDAQVWLPRQLFDDCFRGPHRQHSLRSLLAAALDLGRGIIMNRINKPSLFVYDIYTCNQSDRWFARLCYKVEWLWSISHDNDA